MARVLYHLVGLLALTPAFDPPAGVAVAGSEPRAAAAAGPVKVAPGRFVPLTVAGGKPALLLGNEANLFDVFAVKPGETVIGVRWDEPAGSKAKRYTFPAGATHIALAGDASGTATLTAIVNGAGEGPPTVAGTLVLEVVGARPPPILTPFQTKLQAAYRADGATADSLAKYAALWRAAAKTTVYDASLTTPAAVLAELQAAVKALGLPPGSLDRTARVVANELNPLMPTPATGVLTKATRDGMAAVFARIAADLDTIKGN